MLGLDLENKVFSNCLGFLFSVTFVIGYSDTMINSTLLASSPRIDNIINRAT